MIQSNTAADPFYMPLPGPLDIAPDAAAAAAARSLQGDRPFILVRGWHGRRRKRVPGAVTITAAQHDGSPDSPSEKLVGAVCGEYTRKGASYVRTQPADGAILGWSASPDGSATGHWTLDTPDAGDLINVTLPIPYGERHQSCQRGGWVMTFTFTGAQSPTSEAPGSPTAAAQPQPSKKQPRVATDRRGTVSRRQQTESHRRSTVHPVRPRARSSLFARREKAAQEKSAAPPRPAAQLWDILRQHCTKGSLPKSPAPRQQPTTGVRLVAEMAKQASSGPYRAPPRRIVPLERRLIAPTALPTHDADLPVAQAFTQLLSFHKQCEEFYQTDYARPRPHPSSPSQGRRVGRPTSAPPTRSGRPPDSPHSPASVARALAFDSTVLSSQAPADEALCRRRAYGDYVRGKALTPNKFRQRSSAQTVCKVDAELDCRQGLCDWSFLSISSAAQLHNTLPRDGTTEVQARSRTLAARQRRMDREGAGGKADAAAGFGAWSVIAARARRKAKHARHQVLRRRLDQRQGSTGLAVIAACDERYAFERPTEKEEEMQRLFRSYLQGDKAVDLTLIAQVSESGRAKVAQNAIFQRFHCRGVKLGGNLLTTVDGLGQALRERCVAAKSRITFLDLSSNQLSEIGPEIFSALPSLSTLHIQNNLIAQPEGLLSLRGSSVTSVVAHGNPLEKERRADYRVLLLVLLPGMRSLDFTRLSDNDFVEGRNLRRNPPAWLRSLLSSDQCAEQLSPQHPRR